MSRDNFCLRLNSFEASVGTNWQQLQNEKDFCDVTLACDDKQIKVHKVIISSCSSVLKKILKSNSNPHPFIYLRGVEFEDLVNIVSFMYQGEVNVKEDNLQRFLNTADDLKVNGLFEQNIESSYSKSYDRNVIISDNIQPTTGNHMYNNTMQILDVEGEYSVNQNLNTQRESAKEVDSLKNKSCKKEEFKIQEKGKNSLISAQNNGYFPCNECDKKYSSVTALRNHTSSAHEGITFNCDKCYYKATQKGHLKAHARAVHDGILYSCSQCDFTASFQQSIARHVKKNR